MKCIKCDEESEILIKLVVFKDGWSDEIDIHLCPEHCLDFMEMNRNFLIKENKIDVEQTTT